MLIGSCEVKFKIGDMVQITPGSPIYSIGNNTFKIGLIKSEALLLYIHDWEVDDVLKEFWVYDVIVNGRVFKNVPEEGLKRLENNEDEKNIE